MIKKIAVIGSGAMGLGIAQTAICKGFDVSLFDADQNKLALQIKSLEAVFNKLVQKEKLTPEQARLALTRLTPLTQLDQIAQNDLVIEAIFENVTAKVALIESLNSILSENTILASNTSSISITKLASHYKFSHRLIGLHFFNPVPLMKLVEVISGLQTSDETNKSVLEVCERLGKYSAQVKDKAGFAVNRILLPMINEAIFALEEGVADAKTLDQAMQLGANHPMGPLTLADFVGLDIVLGALEVLQAELGAERYRPAPLLRKMVEAKRLGRKSGCGFFDYTKS